MEMEETEKKLADLPLLELATDLHEPYKDQYPRLVIVGQSQSGQIGWAVAGGDSWTRLPVDLSEQQVADLQKQASEAAASLLSAVGALMGGLRLPKGEAGR